MIDVEISNVVYEYEDGTTLYEIAKDFGDYYENDIILAVCNGKLCELSKVLIDNSKVSFITTANHIGMECYRRSMVFMMIKAFYKIADHSAFDDISVEYSVSKGYYCKINGGIQINNEFLRKLKTEMDSLAKRDMLITKEVMSTGRAISKFKRYRMKDKVNLFKYRRASSLKIYKMEGFEDYFYGYMAYSTGILKYYKLIPYNEGFVLQMPVKESPKHVPEFTPQNKVVKALEESEKWAEKLGVSTIGEINDKIVDGSINDIMMMQEALQEKKIADIASDIASRKEAKIVLIAGPSSSGKTSFAHRLAIQLMAQGLQAQIISTDNYFVNREESPKDENGELNFEALEAVDIELFNDHITKLANGETVEMPEFNFVTGKREFNGKTITLTDDSVLIIEGIHCLNDKLSYSIPEEKKYRIGVSALTPINVDEHNRISSSDLRLLRRIVRDSRTRNISAKTSIERWNKVRLGEEKYIFPFQDSADAIFNSAMVYELSVLKVFAEPKLFGVPKDTEEYLEAKRLLKFLDYILGIPKENVPSNSILSEFVGGSVFPV